MAISRVRGTSGTASLGNSLNVDITSDNVGDLAIVSARCTGAVLPTVPAGWTTVATDFNGNARLVAYRVKQAGDTTFAFAIPGSQTSAYVLDVWRGAAFGQISTATNQAPAGNTVAFDPLTVAATSTSYCVALWTNAAGTVIVMTGYAGGVGGSSITTMYDTTVTAGVLDPPDATLSNSVAQNRIGWHIELVDSAGSVQAGASTMSAASAATAVAALTLGGQATVSAQGNANSAGLLTLSSPVAMSSVESFSGDSQLTRGAAATLLSASDATAAGATTLGGGSSDSSSSDFTADGIILRGGAAALTSQSDATANGGLVFSEALSDSANGSFDVDSGVTFSGAADLAATSDLLVGVDHDIQGASIESSEGALSAVGSVAKMANSVMSGGSSLSAAGTVLATRLGKATLQGKGTQTSKGSVEFAGAASPSATSNASIIGSRVVTGVATASAQSNLIGGGGLRFRGSSVLSAESSISSDAAMEFGGSADVANNTSFILDASVLFDGAAALEGDGLVTINAFRSKGRIAGGTAVNRVSFINGVLTGRIRFSNQRVITTTRFDH